MPSPCGRGQVAQSRKETRMGGGPVAAATPRRLGTGRAKGRLPAVEFGRIVARLGFGHHSGGHPLLLAAFGGLLLRFA